MAIYKPTNCDPQLMTLDLSECDSTPLFLYAKLDSTNTDVTHYSIRLLDEQNNELLNGSSTPYSLQTLRQKIIDAGYSTYLSDYINADTGYNGTYLVAPLIVPYAKRNAFNNNINVMYYDSGIVRNSLNTDLGISNGHSYKWELSLYQGGQSTARPNQVIYYDMVLTSGVVLGSTNKRIQTVPSDEIVSDYYIQPVSIKNPSFIPVSPFNSSSPRAQTNAFLNTDYGEKGWYFTDDGVSVNNHVQSIGPRIPIKTYDSQFGHIYPYDNGSDSFLPSQFKYSADAANTSVARGYRLYKMSGNPDDLTEKQKVKAAPYGAIPWYWNHSTENPSNSYGSFTYYMNKSMYSKDDPVYPFAENMTCAYAEQVSGSTSAYGIYFLTNGQFITGSITDGVKLWNSDGTLAKQNLAGSAGSCFVSNCVFTNGNNIATFIIQNYQLYYLSCNLSTYSGEVVRVSTSTLYSVQNGKLACCKHDSTLYAYVLLDQNYIGTASKNVSQVDDPPTWTLYSIQGTQIGDITKIGFAAEDDYQRLYACGTDNTGTGNAALFRATVPATLLDITFSRIIPTSGSSISGSGAQAHLPYRDANNSSNFYCSMGDTLYISDDGASTWYSRSNTLLGLPAVAGAETPVRAFFGTSQNWITVVNQKEIWAAQDIFGTTSPWRCLYAAENPIPFGLPFNRNLSGGTPFVYATESGLYRCLKTASQNIFVCAQKANVPIYSGDRILLTFQPTAPGADDTSGNNYGNITNPAVPFQNIIPNSQTSGSSKFNGIYVIDVSVKYSTLTLNNIMSGQQVDNFLSTETGANTVQITVVCRRSADADTWGEISNKVIYVQPLSVFETAPTPTPFYAGQNVQIPKSVVDSAGNNGRINKTAITFGTEEAMDLYSRGDAWLGSTSYTAGDIVKYNGHTYVAASDNTGQTPSTSSIYWKQNDAVNSVGLIFYNVPKTTTNTLEYGKLYIRPYSGLRSNQWLREITTGNNPYNIIVQSVNTKYWYVTYYKIFTGDKTNNSASSVYNWYTPDETQYKILTNYRVGDEIYFSFKAKPVPQMIFKSLYENYTYTGSPCNITQPAFTVTATCREYSSDGAPISKWRSYYFVVKDSSGNEVQRSRVKYDNAMSASFFGLPGAPNVSPGMPDSSFPTYNVELHITSVDGVELVHTNTIRARYSNPLCPHEKYVRFEYDCCRGCVKVIICTSGSQCDITDDHKRVFVSKREVWAGDKTGQRETVTTEGGQTLTVDVYDKYSEPLYHPVLIDAKISGMHNYTENGENFYVFNDYNVASNRQYEYIYYILDDNDYTPTVFNHRTGIVKTKTNRWTVTELDYDLSYDDATVYGVNPNNVWMFKYNADGGSQALNISKTQQDTLAQYPFFSMGPKRHMSGSISCLLGVEFLRSNMVTELPEYYYKHISANEAEWKVYGWPTDEPVEAGGYQERLRSKDPNDFVHLSSNQAIDMINQWRNLCYSGRPKLLKSPKGDIYIVQITNSQSTAQYTWNKMPDTISFDWTEIADPYDAIIIGEDDGYECNPCE